MGLGYIEGGHSVYSIQSPADLRRGGKRDRSTILHTARPEEEGYLCTTHEFLEANTEGLPQVQSAWSISLSFSLPNTGTVWCQVSLTVLRWDHIVEAVQEGDHLCQSILAANKYCSP